MTFSNITLVLPYGSFKNSSLEIESGFISKLRLGQEVKGMPEGLTLIPGIIDLHGDMLEREIEPRPGSCFPADMSIRELDKRHASTGISTAYIALSFADYVEKKGSSIEKRTQDLVSSICSLAPSLACDTRIHARFELNYPNTKSMLKKLISLGQVHMVSLMDHSPGQGQFRDLEYYISYMASWLKVSKEAAKIELSKQLKIKNSWETIRDLSDLAKQYDLVIASHDDDTKTKVATMRDFNVSISEFPVSLEAAKAAKDQNMWTIMGAPNALRGGSHSGNLSALDALNEGLLDILASDYYPASMLQAAFAIAKQNLRPFHEAINLISQNPAKAAQLNDRGYLQEGLRADLALVEPKTQQVVASYSAGNLIYWSGRHAEQVIRQSSNRKLISSCS